jgi:hypothetical protein
VLSVGTDETGVPPTSGNSSEPTLAPGGESESKEDESAKKINEALQTTFPCRDSEIIRDEEKQAAFEAAVEEEPSKLRSAFKLACVASFVLCFLMDFLVPIPLFLSHYVFSLHFFDAWDIINFIWVFGSAAVGMVLPIWEIRGFFAEFGRRQCLL